MARFDKSILKALKPSPGLGWTVLLASLVLTALAFWGQYFWLFELASHFRLQYMIVQVVALLWFVIHQQGRYVLAVGLFLALNLTQVGPYLRLTPAPIPATLKTQGYDTLKLLHMNLWVLNPTIERAAGYIQQVQPDVISLQEYSPDWQHKIEATGVLNPYPYRFGYGEDMLYSRLPFEEHAVRTQAPYTLRSYLRGVVRMPHHQAVSLYTLHAYTPVSHSAIHKQRAQLKALGQFVNQERLPVIVMGDLNTTPWGYGFRQLVAHTRLTDTQLFTGMKPSWSIYFGLPWVTIDHCLTTPELFPLKRVAGPYTGSDHLPLYIELAVPYVKPPVDSTIPSYRPRSGLRHRT